MKIFVTGSSGCLARALLPVLCEQPFVSGVTGIDISEPKFSHPKFRHTTLDMRDKGIAGLMEDHQAVIHLGFAVKQGSLSLDEMRSVNFDGSCNVVDAAKALGVAKFINMSSVSVYGAGEAMVETIAKNPPDWFQYAHHKAEVEEYIERHLEQAVQFRAHLIVGANAQQFLREIFLLPVWLDFGRTPPKQQVVHESDVVDAILTALQGEARGIYNLAAADVIALGGDYIRKGIEEGRKIRRLPFGVARVLALLGRIILKKDLMTLIAMLDTTATVDCGKAMRDLGWKPRRSAWDARSDALLSLKRA